MTRISQIVNPWATNIKQEWSTSQIRSALRTHRMGDFGLAANLFDSLWEDDEFPGSMQKRVNATLRSKFRIGFPNNKKRELDPRERALEADFRGYAPAQELFDLMASWIILGVGVATIDWDTSGPLWIPKLRALPTEFLRYDEHARVWEYEAKEGTFQVTPGDGKWVLMTSGQRGWIQGLIRGLAPLWMSKALVLGDWARFNAKHGLPILKVKVPVHADGSEKEEFLDDLEVIQSEGVIALPQEEEGQPQYDIDLLEAKDRSWETFKANVERADRKMQVMLLGGNLGTEVATTGANRAAAEVQALNLDREKAKIDAERLGCTLQEQLIKPFFALNFGEPAEVPFPIWDAAPAEDVRDWAAARSQFAELIATMRAAGVEITNLDQLAEEHGLSITVGEMPKPAAPGDKAPSD